jgi:ATP-dependent helicase HepA
LAPEIVGTFHRNVAKEKRTIEFFSIGEPLFEEIIKSFSEQFAGRTYAISFHSSKIGSSWSGFEVSYFAEPNLSEIENNIGMVNRAQEIFSTPKESLYFDVNGKLSDKLDFLKDLKYELCDFKNNDWKDLSSDELDGYFQDQESSWESVLKVIQKESQIEAHRFFNELIGDEILYKTQSIDEDIRVVRQINAKERKEEIEEWIKLKDSISQWKVRLDSIGFWSIN